MLEDGGLKGFDQKVETTDSRIGDLGTIGKMRWRNRLFVGLGFETGWVQKVEGNNHDRLMENLEEVTRKDIISPSFRFFMQRFRRHVGSRTMSTYS